MKKINFLTSLLLAGLLVSCGKNPEPSENKPSEIKSEPTTEEVHHDPVTITYSVWNLGSADSETPNLDRLMIQEFQSKYPWITVNIVERPKVAPNVFALSAFDDLIKLSIFAKF